MNIPLFTNYFIGRGHRQLYAMMRGYRILRTNKQLPRIMDTKISLTNHVLDIPLNKTSRFIFGAGILNAELTVRQFLLVRSGGFSLNAALLKSLGNGEKPIAFHLPPIWRKILASHGFTVSQFRSAMVWQGFLVACLGYGVIQILKNSINGFKSLFVKNKKVLGRHVYFIGLTKNELPKPGFDGKSYDVISWYLQWPKKLSNLQSACHSVRGVIPTTLGKVAVVPIPKEPTLTRLNQLLNFVAWGLVATTIATIDLLRGRWWHALMLSDATRSCMVRLQDTSDLASEYLFHNSFASYRPLWTYEAESRGSQVTFYFYSTNCEPFKTNKGYPPLPYSWQAMNWSRYLVWNEQQADFIRRCVGSQASIQIVGPIWFSGSVATLPSLPANLIAVFDIQPRRTSIYSGLGVPIEYYIPSICNQFILDIHDLALQSNWIMAWKCKRKIGSAIHPSYNNMGLKLASSLNLVSIDPDTAALSVIEASSIVISMPFTSTALIARSLGKPSYYYDPSGLVQKDDRAAHGIPVISGREELLQLFHSVVFKKSSSSIPECNMPNI